MIAPGRLFSAALGGLRAVGGRDRAFFGASISDRFPFGGAFLSLRLPVSVFQHVCRSSIPRAATSDLSRLASRSAAIRAGGSPSNAAYCGEL
jgi:hypothetical protein